MPEAPSSAPRRSRLPWLRRALLAVLVPLLVLAGSGFTYQTIARERDADRWACSCGGWRRRRLPRQHVGNPFRRGDAVQQGGKHK